MKRTIVLLAALSVIVSCSKELGASSDLYSYIGASIEQPTKTTLAPSATAVNWSEGDAIALAGATSIAKGTLSSGAGTTSASFAYTSSEAPLYGVYPYDGTSVNGTTATVTIPSEQTYSTTEVFAKNVAVMAGKVAAGNISFHNSCSVVEIKLKGAGIVKTVTLSSTSSNIAGESTIDLTSDAPVAVPTASGVKSVTVTVPEGVVNLDAETPVSFYFVVAPGTYSDLSVTVNGQATKASSASHVLAAGHVKSMSAMTLAKVSKFSYKWTLDASHIADQGKYWASINVLADGSESGIAYDDTNAASLQFHQIQLKSHPEVTTNGQTGQYCVYKYAQTNTAYMTQNVWTGDYFEFATPSGSFAAGTCVELRFRMAANDKGPKAWYVQYPDGSSWKNTSETVAKPYGTTYTDDIPCTFSMEYSGDKMPVVYEKAVIKSASANVKMRVTCADGRYQFKNQSRPGSSTTNAGVYFYNGTSITFVGYTLKFQ